MGVRQVSDGQLDGEPSDGGPAVECRGVQVSYGSTAALRGVDLVVEPGGVHGLLGPNGAGKTTLLRALFGLVRPQRGSVRVLGRSPSHDPGRALHGVAGFVEAPRFYPYLSAGRNLDLLAALDGPPAPARVDGALAVVGLAAQADTKAGRLSTGQRQRLGLAAALLRDPRLLVLDEPTSGLDPPGVRDVHELVRELAVQGRTVVLSSHDMAEVESLCDRVTVLARGEVRFDGSLREMRAGATAAGYRLEVSDDEQALAVARTQAGVEVTPEADGALSVVGERDVMDRFTVALGRAGVAVRAMVCRETALGSLFLRLTADAPAPPDDAAPAGSAPVPRQARR